MLPATSLNRYFSCSFLISLYRWFFTMWILLFFIDRIQYMTDFFLLTLLAFHFRSTKPFTISTVPLFSPVYLSELSQTIGRCFLTPILSINSDKSDGVSIG